MASILTPVQARSLWEGPPLMRRPSADAVAGGGQKDTLTDASMCFEPAFLLWETVLTTSCVVSGLGAAGRDRRRRGKTMWKKLIFVSIILCVLMPRLGYGQDAKAVLESVAKAMGDVKSLQYTGSGTNFAFGQNVTPGAPWPRFNVKSYTRSINYDTPAMRDEIVRTQAEPGERGGGGIPLVGEQRQNLMVSGTYAWNQVGENPPAPALA